MIKCNLAMLLAERGLKITKVSYETGLSRTTLTSLANNYGSGIQFDTINTICIYLQITPDKLFSFVPFDYFVDVSKVYHNDFCVLDFTFMSKNKTESALMAAYLSNIKQEKYINKYEMECKKVTSFLAEITFIKEKDYLHYYNEVFHEDREIFTNYFKQIPTIFIKDIEEEILDMIAIAISDKEPEDCKATLAWSIN